MTRRRTIAIALGLAGAAVVVARHRGAALGRSVPGGVLIGSAAVYDVATRLVLGPFFSGIAGDVAAVAPNGARVLEIGCGPGHLAVRLARYGLHVTGLDLDPAMVARARAKATGAFDGAAGRPSFLVGDVASLAFPDRSFDLVVSTLSMHHWADPAAGLAEIARVLRPGARALVWDIRPGVVPLHAHAPDPAEHAHGSPLRVVSAAPWRWPGRLALTQRIELAHEDGPGT